MAIINSELFDRKLRESTTRFLGSLAVDTEEGIRSPSLASLSELKHCVVEPTLQVLQLILTCKDDILDTPDLFDVVNDYVTSNVILTLNICSALTTSLCCNPRRQSIIRVALEEVKYGEGGGKEVYESALRRLKNFEADPDPNSGAFSQLFQFMCQSKNFSFLVTLKDKVEKSKHGLSNVIFSVTFASVIVCSVLAAPQPRVVTAMAEAAAAVPSVANMNEWIDSVWKKYENESNGQRELLNIGARLRDISQVERELRDENELNMFKSYFWTHIGKGDLDEIRGLVDKWRAEVESVLQNNCRDETAAMLALDELKKKLSEFMETMEDLSDYYEDGLDDILKGRAKFERMKRINELRK